MEFKLFWSLEKTIKTERKLSEITQHANLRTFFFFAFYFYNFVMAVVSFIEGLLIDKSNKKKKGRGEKDNRKDYKKMDYIRK